MHTKPLLDLLPRGAELLNDPWLNKGSAFTDEERELLGLRGLLPPRTFTMEEQVARNLENLRAETSPLQRYLDLMDLLNRNVTLFYRLVIDHLEEMMPIIYTPTVGQACLRYGHFFRRAYGLFITSEDKGRVDNVLQDWPNRDVRVICLTDGERILGLGDLGAYGMGIPIGKLSLYTACAGLHPARCLPVTLDVGTDNTELLSDPYYLGQNQRRVRGPEYDELVAEFIEAAERRFPGVLIQFEDFGTGNAFRLLEQYRDRVCCFNDDIQGTASVALGGLFSAMRAIDSRMEDQKILFLGAGEAGLGIGELVVADLMKRRGLSEAEARRRCWYVDSRGLVVASRTDLSSHKKAFAHDHEPVADFRTAVEKLRPTAIIGVAAQPGMFGREVLEMMGQFNKRPIVFALSNPTSKAECTAKEAYTWTQGRAVFASGSPFDPVSIEGRTLRPGQGNNAYIFPGVGLAVVACEIRRVTNEMFAAAAEALSQQVSDADLAAGLIYPPLKKIREVSAKIALAVARVAYERNLADVPMPKDLEAHIRSHVFEPVYRSYV